MHCCTRNLSQWGYFIRDCLLIPSAEGKTPALQLLRWGEGKKKKYLLTGVEHDTECESVCLCPFRLSPSVPLTGSLQWISLLCVCSLSHSGGRQTRLTPQATSACLLLCARLVFFFVLFLAALSTAYVSLSRSRVRALLCLSAPLVPRWAPTHRCSDCVGTLMVRAPRQGPQHAGRLIRKWYRGDGVSYFCCAGQLLHPAEIKRVSMWLIKSLDTLQLRPTPALIVSLGAGIRKAHEDGCDSGCKSADKTGHV